MPLRRWFSVIAVAVAAALIAPAGQGRAAVDDATEVSYGFFGFEPMVSSVASTVDIVPTLTGPAIDPTTPLQFRATITGNHRSPHFRYVQQHGDTRSTDHWGFEMTEVAGTGTGTALFPDAPFTVADEPELLGEHGMRLPYEIGLNEGSYSLQLQLLDLSDPADPVAIGSPATKAFTVDGYDDCDTEWDIENVETGDDAGTHSLHDAANWTDGAPGPTTLACFGGGFELGTITVDQPTTLRGLYFGGSQVELQVNAPLHVTNHVDGSDVVVGSGASLTVDGHVDLDSLTLPAGSTTTLTSRHFTGYHRVDVGYLTLDGGTLSVAGDTLSRDLAWSSGRLEGHGALDVDGLEGQLLGTGPMEVSSATLRLLNPLDWLAGDLTLRDHATVHITDNGELDIDGTVDLLSGDGGGGQVVNEGELDKDSATGPVSIDAPVYSGETAEIYVRTGSLELKQGLGLHDGVLGGRSITLGADAVLDLSGQADPIRTLGVDLDLSAPGSRITGPEGTDALSSLEHVDGRLVLRPGYALALAGDVLLTDMLFLPTGSSLTTPGTLTLGVAGAEVAGASTATADGGDLTMAGGSISAGLVDVPHGCIWGAGRITGDVLTGCLGTDTSDGPGGLDIVGDLTLPTDDSYLGFGVLSAEEHGRIDVSGTAVVDGLVEVWEDDYPSGLEQGDRLPLLTAATLVGAFDESEVYVEDEPLPVVSVDLVAGEVVLSVPDVSAPTWPDGAALTPSAVTASSARISWPAAADNVGVTGYLVTVDGAETPLSVPGTQTHVDLTGLTTGHEHAVAVAAVDAAGLRADGPVGTVTPTAPVTGGGGGPAPGPAPAPAPTETEASSTLPPGDTLSTAGSESSPANPVITSVTSPQGGAVTVTERPLAEDATTAGYSLLGQAIDISAPAGSVEKPLTLAFRLDGSQLPPGETADTVTVQRNGVPVLRPCEDPEQAVPDPCLLSRTTDGDDVLIAVRTSRASTWAFVAPEAASLEAACPDVTGDSGFRDVPASDVHAAAVECLRILGITAGSGGGGFSPAQPVTRGQMASFVARLLTEAGLTLPESPDDAFQDDDGDVHETATDALAELGVVKGVDAQTYGGGLPVTRAQMAALLDRAYGLLGGSGGLGAADAFRDDDASVHEAAIDRLVQLGVVTGTTATSYAPERHVSRAQMASFLARLTSRLVAEGTVALTP